MKNAILLFGLLLSLGIFVTACGGAPEKSADEPTEQTEAPEADANAEDGHDHAGHDHAMEGDSTAADAAEQGPEYTSAYVCPMHCEGSGSAEPGKCPVCGMEYVANEASEE